MELRPVLRRFAQVLSACGYFSCRLRVASLSSRSSHARQPHQLFVAPKANSASATTSSWHYGRCVIDTGGFSLRVQRGGDGGKSCRSSRSRHSARRISPRHCRRTWQLHRPLGRRSQRNRCARCAIPDRQALPPSRQRPVTPPRGEMGPKDAEKPPSRGSTTAAPTCNRGGNGGSALTARVTCRRATRLKRTTQQAGTGPAAPDEGQQDHHRPHPSRRDPKKFP